MVTLKAKKMGIYSVQLKLRGKEEEKIFKKLFSCVILRLYTEFQCPTMPGTGQKVCGEWWWVGI